MKRQQPSKPDPASPPCLMGETNPDIDPAYFGLQEQSTMQILAGNTIIYCTHWHDTVAFYRDVLQFTPTFTKEDWFMELRALEGCHISIADAARCTIPPSHGQGLTLSFRVQELAAAHKRMTELGVETTPITSQSWRAPYFYVYDPAGTRIELWSDIVGAQAI